MTLESSDDQDEKEFVCPYSKCDLVFPRPGRLQHHLSTHEGKKPYVCEVEGCDKAYVNPSGLKRHKKSHAVEPAAEYQRKLTCTESDCNVSFTNKQNLQRHIKRTHKKKTTYKCETCSKEFPKHSQLINHEFEHKGPKPFACSHDGCGRTFDTRSHLTQHQKSHAGRHYKCETMDCDFECDKWSMLRKHKKLQHPPEYKCEHCDKMFRTKSNLRVHVSTHGQERQIFTCPHAGCRRFYYFDKNLKHHISSTHEGKTFECTHQGCERQFKHKVILERHLKLHSSSADFRDKKKMRKSRKRRSMLARLSSFKVPAKQERVRLQDVNVAPELPGTSESDSDYLPRVLITIKGDGGKLGGHCETGTADESSLGELDTSVQSENDRNEVKKDHQQVDNHSEEKQNIDKNVESDTEVMNNNSEEGEIKNQREEISCEGIKNNVGIIENNALKNKNVDEIGFKIFSTNDGENVDEVGPEIFSTNDSENISLDILDGSCEIKNGVTEIMDYIDGGSIVDDQFKNSKNATLDYSDQINRVVLTNIDNTVIDESDTHFDSKFGENVKNGDSSPIENGEIFSDSMESCDHLIIVKIL